MFLIICDFVLHDGDEWWCMRLEDDARCAPMIAPRPLIMSSSHV